MKRLLELDGIVKSFPSPSGGSIGILSGVDLAVHEGEVVSIVGRSGSGKSTLLAIAALLMKPMPTSGEKVSYYICKLDGKKNPDWKCARPVELYDRENLPYDAQYYLKKIDDWQKRFAELSGAAAVSEADSKPSQAELF